MDRGTYTLRLAKEDFKFSCAHFTVFGPDEAELLHGHNYQVEIELTGKHLDEEGLLASFVEVKAAIRLACKRLDSKTLIPALSRHLDIRDRPQAVEVRYRDRLYVLPDQDVLLLPIANTSIELFARMFWQELVSSVDLSKLDSLGVSVAETAGQSCYFRAPLH
jgi:6-pyruvoyltetrahydropterin/6-carboxytetrahydropterin synthase